jgi:hypothetical protein
MSRKISKMLFWLGKAYGRDETRQVGSIYVLLVNSVARMEWSGMREQRRLMARPLPDFASLHPGYRTASPPRARTAHRR